MSKDTANSTRKKIIAASIILAVGGVGFMFGWLSANDWFFSKNPIQVTPDLDGTIEKREWMKSSYYNIPFYLDVNNTIDPFVDAANVDGWNYLSVAEDEDNYYLAIDLCSDQTNNPDGEWVAVALANRMPQISNTKLGLYAIEDYGFEYLMYNVTTDDVVGEEIIFGSGAGNYNDIPFVPEYDSYDIVKGSMEGDYLDFWYTDEDHVLTLKSEYYEVDSHNDFSDIVAVDFAINVTEKFPQYNASDFLSSINKFDLRMKLTGNISANTSLSLDYAEYFTFRVAEHGPMAVAYEDPNYLSDLNNIDFSNGTYELVTANLDYNEINSSDGMFYFSLFGWNNLNVTNPSEFEIYIDQLEFKIGTNLDFDTTRGTSLNPGNYDVSYSFGSSEMCVEEHRMFEIRFSKSEYPNLVNEMLYVNIAGCGTTATTDSNYWTYPLTDGGMLSSSLFQFYDDDSDFLRFDMSIT